MTQSEMIAFLKANPYVKVTHTLFEPNEYIYADENGYVFDESEECILYCCEAICTCFVSYKMCDWTNGWQIKN